MILGQPQPGSATQVVPGISAQLPLGKGLQAQSQWAQKTYGETQVLLVPVLE